MKLKWTTFDTIKDVITKNNSRIKKLSSDLALLYLGFCEHLLAYIDAYKLVFESKNYYVCHSIERMMLDLYIKSRLLPEVEDPEDLAKWFWEGKSIRNYSEFSAIKSGDLKKLGDIDLCKYFDKQDNNYSFYPGTKDKISEDGWFEKKYRETSNFIHPSKEAALEYWKRYNWTKQDKQILRYNEENEKKQNLKYLLVIFLNNYLKFVVKF